jgi:hypothetical protein
VSVQTQDKYNQACGLVDTLILSIYDQYAAFKGKGEVVEPLKLKKYESITGRQPSQPKAKDAYNWQNYAGNAPLPYYSNGYYRGQDFMTHHESAPEM